MLPLKQRLEKLEIDVSARPMRHFTYNNLPFALFCYRPDEEWAMRRELRRLQTRLELGGRAVRRVSLADLLWQAIDETDGLPEIAAQEVRQGYATAQAQVARRLYEHEEASLPRLLLAELNQVTGDPDDTLVFITRTGALAPGFYRVSALLDKMTNQTKTRCVLFMPATGDEHGLSFMGVAEMEPRGSYHTKVYL